MMIESSDETSEIDERTLRNAISHLTRWHAIGAIIGFLITLIVAYGIVRLVTDIGWINRTGLKFIDALPFVTTAGRVEVVIFAIAALLLLALTGVGTGIASDIVRTQIIKRINAQPNPIALAEAMKNRLRARSGRLEQQYRFFPKHAADNKLQDNGLFVGIGTLAPYFILMVLFFFYFRW